MEEEKKELDNVNDNTNDNANDAQQADKNAIDLQARIDSAVKTRVAREKEQQKILQQQWDEERQALIAENELLKKQFQAKLDQELEEIPTSFRSLISKLPVAEQITWLEEQEKEKQTKPKTPIMPNFDKKPNENKGEIKHIAPDRIA